MSRQCGKFNLPHKHRWVNYVYAIRSSFDGSKVLMLVRESVPGSHNGDVYSVYLVDVSRGISEEGNEVQHYICLAAYREIPNWTTIPIAMNENGTVVAVGDPNNRIINVYQIDNVSNKDSLTENHTLYEDADDVAITADGSIVVIQDDHKHQIQVYSSSDGHHLYDIYLYGMLNCLRSSFLHDCMADIIR